MSTKTSIALADNVHVYLEMYDSTGLYVRVEHSDSTVTVVIPKEAVLELLGKAGQVRNHLETDWSAP